ncbi:HEPN domain-containing protein [Limnothrix sp. PR1529]|uniref:HEPN domain-containing protein n=1 Tax=Limnothrix sp. PR1529 TaxID=1704291 RepID=UPI00117BBC31|nr:HEPN domain-containing protein [Limnothrix sp. PR1529]
MASSSLRNFYQNKSRIDSSIKRAKSVEDMQIQSDLARYICIRIAGLIETTVRDFYTEYAESKSTQNVAKYVGHKLEKFQNPDMNKLKMLATEFSESWGQELEELEEIDRLAVTSIVKTRHSIAHGGDTSISLAIVEAYYKRVLKVLLVIQNQCDITEG